MEYDKKEIPCLASVGNAINADMYGDLKYYGNKIFCWLCCMIICGPFFIILGLSSLADAAGVDERMLRIPAYNTAVKEWNSAGAAAFTDIKFSLKIEDGTGVTGSVGSAVSIEGSKVAGMCSANSATATGLAEASTPAGTFQYACGTGFQLKTTSATVFVDGADDAAKKAQCCNAIISGMCEGNTKTATGLEPHGTAPTRRLASHLPGTFQFKCAVNKRLKANAAAITGATGKMVT